MKTLDLLPIGNFDERLLREVAPALADAFRVPVQILGERLDPQFAFHRERQQYHSSEILQAMQEHAANGAWRVLGITGVDLYIPILTFVFGEAQMGGPCAVVARNHFHQRRRAFHYRHCLLTQLGLGAHDGMVVGQQHARLVHGDDYGLPCRKLQAFDVVVRGNPPIR